MCWGTDRELVRLGIKALKKYVLNPTTLTLEGLSMTTIPTSDYQLNAGDSVVVTITDTDDVTGATVTPDAGSVLAVLSSSTDTVVVDPSGTFLTITAGGTDSVGNTVTVSAEVNGVASASAVGTYDVVAATPDATSLSLSFGTETAPVPVASEETPKVFNETTGNFE
jgi:hypothetical protein